MAHAVAALVDLIDQTEGDVALVGHSGGATRSTAQRISVPAESIG